MTDFVTTLEQQLHQAAVRQENAGAVRRVALPRMRIAVPRLAAAAVIVVVLGLALAGIAAVFLGSQPQRAGLPSELEGGWRIPSELGVEDGQRLEFNSDSNGVNSLQLLPAGAERCADVGIESACYVIDDTAEGALEWGEFRVSGDEMTFRSANSSAGEAGVYRWQVRDGSLRLTEIREPRTGSDRSLAFGAGPLPRAGRDLAREDADVPQGWTTKRFDSTRYDYSIRYPQGWTPLAASAGFREGALALDTSDAVDKFSRDPQGVSVPSMAIAAHPVPNETTSAAWTKEITDHLARSHGCDVGETRNTRIGGEAGTISIYPTCGRGHHQWATVVHAGRGYQIAWVGEFGRAEADAARFRALVKTIRFSR